mmetsp:Transcript_14022/g.46773  ORF Transcript_14022/g.46773 Transcript_14022/m.46773 type:complete len:147 (-) Transcript_14022:12-452(-)
MRYRRASSLHGSAWPGRSVAGRLARLGLWPGVVEADGAAVDGGDDKWAKYRGHFGDDSGGEEQSRLEMMKAAAIVKQRQDAAAAAAKERSAVDAAAAANRRAVDPAAANGRSAPSCVYSPRQRNLGLSFYSPEKSSFFGVCGAGRR